MFIAANTRRPATTSSMFEFDFEMEFPATKCVKGRFNYVTVQAKTNLVHTSDSAWLMTCKQFWNYIVMSHLLSCKF